MPEFKILFLPAGKEVAARPGTTILDAAREGGVYIESSCGGRGTCGKCRVQLQSGSGSGITETELDHLTGAERDAGYRLACRTRPESDLVVLVPAESLVLGSVAKKGFRGGLGGLRPAVTSGASPLLGAALDVGTTTLALYLCDLATGELVASASSANPQIQFGADIMSRIAYSVAHPGTGLRLMQQRLSEAVNGMIHGLTSAVGTDPAHVVDMTAAGNTVMHHILLGVPPDTLGRFPFMPLRKEASRVPARDLGIFLHPSAKVYVLPVEAGFVGADNVAVLIAEEPYRHRRVSLTIDIGTNGELVIGNRDRLLCCSCATGPALEGAQISCGMRALPGAIDTVRLEATGDVHFSVISAGAGKGARPKPAGICGSGIIDTVAELLRARILQPDGAFAKDFASDRLRPSPGGGREFVIVAGRHTAHGADIVITQRDVRQIQLAKAAISTGARLLMREFGVASVDRLTIAGAFGTHLDIESARSIGLLPDMPEEMISVVGNAAGRGVCLALLDTDKRAEAERIARWVEHVELARLPDFQKTFIDSTRFERM